MTAISRLLCVTATVLISGFARAHSDGAAGANPWTIWPFEPEILAGAVVLPWFYGVGWVRRQGRAGAVSVWRHVSFFAGLVALLIALQSPLDTVADHSFAMHQVQHLFLGAIGPILLMLAVPQALLVSGMPRAIRNRVLAPVLASRAVRTLFSFFAHSAVATFLAIAVLFIWHLPAYHNLAVLDIGVHYAMHVTFLVSGLFFFWRVLDSRPAPLGATYGVRIAMSLAAISASAPLGAYLALKSSVLYPAYDEKGRLGNLGALQDEQLGGLVMWVPGGLVLAVPLLIVIKLWGAREDRLDVLRRRGFAPPSGQSPADTRNRALGWRLAAIAAASGATVIAIGVLQRFLP